MQGKKTPHIVAIGELLWDLLPSGARLGGAPANFAVFCAQLGNRTTLVTSVGEDCYGRSAREALPQPNLDLSQLQTSAYPTGTVAVTFSHDNQPRYEIIANVAWDAIRLTPQLLQQASTADAICFGTLGQRNEVSRATIRSFLEASGPNCVRVCDVNLRMPFCTPEVLRWSLAHANLIKVSDEELPEVFSLLGSAVAVERGAALTPEVAAHALLAAFPQCELVATTLGAKGSMVATRTGEGEHSGFPITVVDTIGAGDAFTAGLVHAYLRGASLAQMAEVGNLCGSYVASQSGATPALSAALIGRIEGRAH